MTVERADNGPPRVRILAVEDEFLLSVVLQEDLRAAGYAVVGPFGTLAQAQDALRRESFDFAVLDINLGGTMVYPLAEELQARGTPFLFLTGYARTDMPERFANVPRLSKPYDSRVLLREIERSLAARAQTPPGSK